MLQQVIPQPLRCLEDRGWCLNRLDSEMRCQDYRHADDLEEEEEEEEEEEPGTESMSHGQSYS